MKCPDIAPLVTRFFDGELDGPHMRTVALHITRCSECEDELRLLEKLQGLVAEQAAADIAGIDTSSIWSAVAAEIDEAPPSWTHRLRSWWEDLEILSPVAVWPGLAAAAAVFLAVNFWQASTGTPGRDFAKPAEKLEIFEHVATVGRAEQAFHEALGPFGPSGMSDNSAVFESIVGGVDGLMIEPKTQTAVLWISDSGDFQ